MKYNPQSRHWSMFNYIDCQVIYTMFNYIDCQVIFLFSIRSTLEINYFSLKFTLWATYLPVSWLGIVFHEIRLSGQKKISKIIDITRLDGMQSVISIWAKHENSSHILKHFIFLFSVCVFYYAMFTIVWI
jgi:hypothetical protein